MVFSGTAMIVSAAIAAAASATTAAVAARSQKNAAKTAANAEMSALDKQIAFEKEKEAERKAEWERAQTEAKTQWEAAQALEETRYNTDVGMRRAEFELAKQKYVNRQAQMAPYRQVGVGALAQLAGMAGLPSPAPAAAPLLETMPDDWKPGDPVTVGATKTVETPKDEAATQPTSLLENEQILPPSLPVEPTRPQPTQASVTPTMASSAYQSLAAPRAPGMTPLTPEQVAALVKASGGRPLSALARARRAAV